MRLLSAFCLSTAALFIVSIALYTAALAGVAWTAIERRNTLCGAPSRSWFAQHVWTRHWRDELRALFVSRSETNNFHWPIFDAIGPLDPNACPTLPLLVLGQGDDAKRACWSPAVASAASAESGCVVLSLGSNNQWSFEEAMVRLAPHCTIHTFDCTVARPRGMPIDGNVVFHRQCIGRSGTTCGHMTIMEIVQLVGKTPLYLKIDIEGWEYEALAEFLVEAHGALPSQIAVELHASTPLLDLDERMLRAFVFMMREVGGYVPVHRRDNPLGYGASEVLFVLAR